MTEDRKFALDLLKILLKERDFKLTSCCDTEDIKRICLEIVETKVLAVEYLVETLKKVDDLKFDICAVNEGFHEWCKNIK